MRLSTLSKIICIFFVASSAISGCKPKFLPNTSIPDNESNRKVAQFLQQYVKALESRSVPDLMALVSPDYATNLGTSSLNDNYGYEQLKEKLEKYFLLTTELRVNTHIQNIQEKDGKIFVTYYFAQKITVILPSGEQKTSLSDVNRLVLAKKVVDGKDTFEILSGL